MVLSKDTCCFTHGIGQVGRDTGGVKFHQGDFSVEGWGMSVHTFEWQERTWASCHLVEDSDPGIFWS